MDCGQPPRSVGPRRSVGGMTHHRRRARPRPATVYGEPLRELLPALAATCSGGQVLPAGASSGYDQDMLSLSLTLPPRVGGSVGRALLRSQAEILRFEADAMGARAPAPVCQHCRDAAALWAVAERLQQVARASGVTGSTLAERALLLGRFTSEPCHCHAAG